jgi:proteasome lid subunit RPN8/RPN11
MIIVARAVLRQIMGEAEAAFPGECCGLLVGQRRDNGDIAITMAAASKNLGKAQDRFEIDPRLWVDLTRAKRGGTEGVVGLYHSHPNAPAQPSSVDLEAAWGEELIWLIAAVAGGDGPAQAIHVTAHVLDYGGRQFRELPLRTEDWHPYPVRAKPEGES